MYSADAVRTLSRKTIFSFCVLFTLTGCGKLWNDLESSSVACSTSAALTGVPYAGGTGSLSDPYQICTATQLNAIGTLPQYWGSSFILESNIDMSAITGSEFNMIGDFTTLQPFTGVFNGNGFTISNFTYVSAGAAGHVALFSYIGDAAVIENITLQNPSVSAGAGSNVGALIGSDDQSGKAVVSNISVIGSSASVSGASYAGSIAGLFSGTLSNSFSSATVVATGGITGGLVGYLLGSLEDSYFTGQASATGTLGGLAGAAQNASITQSYSTGTLSTCASSCGGLVGGAQTVSISNSHFSGTLVSTGAQVGGVAGYMSGLSTITSSYSTGAISGGSIGGLSVVGGLVGTLSQGTISDSYYSGSVVGTASEVGGLVGSLSNSATISGSFELGSVAGANNVGGLVGSSVTGSAGNGIYNSYSQGNVRATASGAGGLIGSVANSPDIQNSYASGHVQSAGTAGGISGIDSGTGIYVEVFFDDSVNPALSAIGSGNAGQNAVGHAVGASTNSMQTAATFTGASWSSALWSFVTNGTYETLAWE